MIILWYDFWIGFIVSISFRGISFSPLFSLFYPKFLRRVVSLVIVAIATTNMAHLGFLCLLGWDCQIPANTVVCDSPTPAKWGFANPLGAVNTVFPREPQILAHRAADRRPPYIHRPPAKPVVYEWLHNLLISISMGAIVNEHRKDQNEFANVILFVSQLYQCANQM